jgi:hypothetical protein
MEVDMSDDVTDNPVVDETRRDSDGLASELSRLGENLGKLVRATWESEERKSVEKEIKAGLDKLNQQLNHAIEQTRVEDRLTKVRSTTKSAWETAHGPQVLREMQAGLIDSLKRLNDEIAKRAEYKPAHEVSAELPEVPPATDQPEHKPTE